MATTDFEEKQSTRSATMVLQNPELLERILWYHSEYKRTLLSASLTAKAFSEPAFNVLWYKMNSIWPLFRVLPTFEIIDGKYVFTGPIRNGHLQRLKYYAKRVRFLAFHDVFRGAYSNIPRDLILSTFMRMDKLGAFVPLRRIQIHGDSCNTILFPLTPPNLDVIEIRTKSLTERKLDEIGIASFLQSVASHSPLLRCLVIEGPFTRITLQVLPDFINLNRLEMRLEDSDSAHFRTLLPASMPSLRYLVICIRKRTNDRPQRLEQPHSISQLHFPSLETLKVACNFSQLENLLGALDAPLLKSTSLVLTQSVASVGTDMRKLFRRNLRVLKDKVYEFAIVGVISMSDVADTFDLDESWSRSLTHLQLSQTSVTNPFNSMSIAALPLIADACPSLKSLQISIHHPAKPEKQTMRNDGQERKPHGLQNLIFMNLPSNWDDTMSLGVEFVSLLEHVFPRMAVPVYQGYATHNRMAWWKGVQDMWRMCQTIKDGAKFK